MIAKGFHQQYDTEYLETFSPIVKLTTFRTVLTLVVTNSWPVHQIDINNVFLYGKLQEDVYMVQPLGFEAADRNLVCKLCKFIYALNKLLDPGSLS